MQKVKIIIRNGSVADVLASDAPDIDIEILDCRKPDGDGHLLDELAAKVRYFENLQSIPYAINHCNGTLPEERN